MNRKIMMSAFSILSALALLGGGAFAAFTTSATTTGNTFSTTNPNLQVNTGSGFGNPVTGFTESGLTPGADGVIHNFSLKNTDTDSNATMTITGQINPTAGDPSLESSLQVRMTCNNGTDTGYVSMATWMSTPQPLNTLGPNSQIDCTMQVKLPTGNTTDANKSITFDTQFNASVGQ